MKENSEDKFSVFVPFEITKGNDVVGDYSNMMIRGVASTSAKDSDDEILEPTGFDLSKFLSTGTLNWHHQWTDDPLAIIGEPVKADIRDNKLYIEGRLYPDSKKARDVYDLAKILEKGSTGRRLGFSIEGKALVRDPRNKKRITRASISNCAITPNPKNPGTEMTIMKGGVSEWEFEEANGSMEFLVDVTDDKGVRRTVDKFLNIKVYPLDKAVDVAAISPTVPEHVEHDTKKVKVPGDYLVKNKLSKGEAYVQLMNEGYNQDAIKYICEIAKEIDGMTKIS